MFAVNQALIAKAQAVLGGRREFYWVIGAACAGKSTVVREIAATTGLAVYDMDEHIFGAYMALYRPERHPASKAWFSAENPLAWALSLPLEDFDALNRAANAEYLDLLADEFAQRPAPYPMLIDGGFTHPSILTQVTAPEQIVCLATSDADRVRIWDTDPARAEMKAWILALPNPAAMWAKFLQHDQQIADTLIQESQAFQIKIFWRNEQTKRPAQSAAVADLLIDVASTILRS